MTGYPPAYLGFLELFNQERFWDAHEVLEGSWRANRSPFYKGLIIYASAFVHVQRGNPAGVVKQMAKVMRYLPPYRPSYLGLDVEAILQHAEQSRRRVMEQQVTEHQAMGNESALLKERRLRELVAFPRLRLDRSRCRGDEPELFS